MSDVVYSVLDSNGGEFRLQVNGANLELLRDNVIVDVRPLASVTSYTLNGGDGSETLVIDQLVSLSGGVFFNGGLPNGAPGDAIVVGSNADTAAYTYTNTTDGRIVFESGGATSVYNFTGIDPLINGGAVNDFVFNLPGGTNTQLEDDGITGNNMSRLRDVNGGYEQTTFTHPTHSLTVNGTATDNVTVNLVDSLGAANAQISAGAVTVGPNGLSTSGNITFTTGNGAITLNAGGALSGATVDLSAAGGGVVETATSHIAATTLQSSSGVTGTVSLVATANNIANIGNFAVTGGDFVLVDSGALTVSGPLSAANVNLTAVSLIVSAGGSITTTGGTTVTVTTGGAFDGVISGTGGFTENGTGAITFTAAEAYGGATTINGGTLLVDGSIANSTTTVNNGGTLGGTGTTGAVIVANGGTLSPGDSPGILTTGDLTLSSGSHFHVELGGNVPGSGGYDQVDVIGTVTLDNATLDLSTVGGFVPSYLDGDTFTIIDNDGADPVTGTFAGLAEGSQFAVGGKAYAITYHGGDGNDVTLFAVAPNHPPQLSGPDSVIAAAGAGTVDLRISAFDLDSDPLTVTLSAVPGYGTLQYFDGAVWVTATSGAVITETELESLRYTPPASGEHGGEALVYSVSDGVNTVSATIGFTVETDSPGPANLFFPAFAGPGNGGNPDLFTLDGSGNPVAIPINAPNGSFAGEDGGFYQFAGNMYFNAHVSGSELLLKMAPDGTVTEVPDTADPGQFFPANAQVSANFIEFDGKLYFTAGQLGEVSADGSSQLIDINGIHQAFTGNLYGGFVEFDHSLYFSAFNDQLGAGLNAPDLIKFDADGTVTAISTRASGNEAFGSSAGEDGGFIVFNNALYFNAFSDTRGDTLFRLDAGSTTPVLVDPSGHTLIHLPTSADTSSAFHIFNDDLYFNEFSPTLGNGTLFRLDTSGNLTPLTYGGEALNAAGALNGMVDFAGSMFFVATTASTGTALFKMDSCGCIDVVYDNGGADAFGDNIISGFGQFNGSLYFDAYDGFGGDSLFKVDATFDPLFHPATIVDLGNAPGATTLAGSEGGFKVLGDSMYFSAETPDGFELVRIDSVGAVHVYDINPGANGSDPGSTDNTEGDGFGVSAFGAFSLPVLHGTGQQDLIVGGSQNEVLDGLGGDDLLAGGGGNDILIGGGGADLFVFGAAGPSNVSRIMDYSFAGGDAVDLSALLDGHLTPTSNIADFVRLIAVGQNIELQVDVDGPANGQNWSDVAILDGSNTVQLDEVTAFFDNVPHALVENDSFNLHTTALAGGGWVVTWTQTGDEDGTPDYNVYARVFDASGHQITGTFEVSSPNDMDDQNSIVTALSGGGFAVTWESCADEILTRVFDANGADLSGPEQPVITLAPLPSLTQVVALANGGYAVLWSQDDGGDDNVYLNAFDANGGSLSSGPQLVNDPNSPVSDLTVGQSFSTVGFGDRSSMVALQHGFAVMWESLRDDGGGNTHEDVFVRVFNFDGTPVTGEIQVNGPDNALQDTPNEIVALGGDNFAVQWESDTLASAQTTYSRLFVTSDFLNYTSPGPVRDDANADSNILAQPWHLAALNNGGYVSLWGQYDIANSPNADVFIQVYDANGNIAAGSHSGGIDVSTVSGVPNFPDQVVSLAGGGVVVMYDTVRDDGTGSGADQDVFVRLFANDGTATTPEIRVNAANGLLDAAVETIALPDGTFAVVWTQDAADGAHQDVVLQHFTAAGAFAGPALLIGSTPFDSSDPQEHSFVSELRDSLSSNGTLLVAAIDGVTFDFDTVFPNTGLNYTYPLDLHFVSLGTASPPVDQAPVNTVPGAQSIEANTAAAIAGLSIADPDAASGTMTTTLSVAHGTLTVAALGGASVAGSGSSTVTLNGTVAQINAALGSNNVVYQGNHDYFDTDTLTIVTNDNGNTGTGGPLTDTDHVAINLTTHLFGTPGDDTFTALPGNERIDAFGGVDTINFNFKLVDARVSYLGNTTVIDGPNGSHTALTGFEVFKFTDGTVNNNDGDPLVDDLFYYSQYHDVWNAHVDADLHYHTFGWHEGRDPDPFFSTSTYLSINKDVKAANIDPLIHFDQSGWKEGRAPSIAFNDAAYLAANPDVAAAHVDPLAQYLANGAGEGRQPIPFDHLLASNGFDYVYYLQHNPDVAAAHVDPFQHFETVGWKEGRNPNAYFDTTGYLAAYADVAAAHVNPLDQYDQSGWKEGRDPSVNFDTKHYLAAYPDVAAAHIDPLVHFLQHGIQEGRSSFADGHFG